MTIDIFYVGDDELGEHYDWEINLSAMVATLRSEGTVEWRRVREHAIRRATDGWEYYEDADQLAEEIAGLEIAARQTEAVPLASYPPDARALEAARRDYVVGELHRVRAQQPGWRPFAPDTSAAIDEAKQSG